jgi:hypothetical protein
MGLVRLHLQSIEDGGTNLGVAILIKRANNKDESMFLGDEGADEIKEESTSSTMTLCLRRYEDFLP